MPTLTAKEAEAIYQTWWSLKIPFGKWMKFARYKVEGGKGIYITYDKEAERLARWKRSTIMRDETGRRFYAFADIALSHTLNLCNQKDYRTVVVDAPLSLRGMK